MAQNNPPPTSSRAVVPVPFEVSSFLEKSKVHLDNFFPSWQSSGETYMIPLMPTSQFPGTTDVDYSRFVQASKLKGSLRHGQQTKSKKQSLTVQGMDIKGQSAESLVQKFLASSNQHCFVLSNFEVSKFRRLFCCGKYDTSNSFLHEVIKMEDFETDFLIFHADAGIVAIECKSTEKFNPQRYSESKQQLEKVGKFLDIVQKLMEENRGQPREKKIPVKKVISFPFVDMQQDKKDPYNLGRKALIHQPPQSWWSFLLAQSDCDSNLFDDPIYQDMIKFIMGMYDVCELSVGQFLLKSFEQITTQKFYENCSALPVSVRNQDMLRFFDQLIFANPEQQEFLKSEATRLVLVGEFGTGKSTMVMEKALLEMRVGRKVAISAPENLMPKYLAFKTAMDQEYDGLCTVKSHEDISWNCFEKLKGLVVFIDEFQHFMYVKLKDDLFLSSFFERDTSEILKIIITFTPSLQFDLPLIFPESEYPRILLAAARYNFCLIILKSVIRGTSTIVKHWKSTKRCFSAPPDLLYNLSNYKSEIGHNFEGLPVEQIQTTREELQDQLLEIILKLKFNFEQTSEASQKLWTSNICVLLKSQKVVSALRYGLLQGGIPVGSIAEQFETGKVVAVDETVKSLSYEWPVVVTIFFEEHVQQDDPKLSMSRAVGHLIVLSVTSPNDASTAQMDIELD